MKPAHVVARRQLAGVAAGLRQVAEEPEQGHRQAVLLSLADVLEVIAGGVPSDVAEVGDPKAIPATVELALQVAAPQDYPNARRLLGTAREISERASDDYEAARR